MTITVNPHPQVMCDTVAERDSLPGRSGMKVFCRETEENYIHDGSWKAVAWGTPGPTGDDGYTPIKGVDYFDGINGQDSIVPGPPGSDADVTAHEAANTTRSCTRTPWTTATR